MRAIINNYEAAKLRYDAYQISYTLSKDVVIECLKKLNADANLREFGEFSGTPNVPYHVADSGERLSRPFRNEMFIRDIGQFSNEFDGLIEALRSENTSSVEGISYASSAIYTAIISFAACYDLWKPGSRKTPGTFFEVLMGGLFKEFLPSCEMSKFIRIENDGDEGVVSTDLVVQSPDKVKWAVIPLKITTRERIVQPFAHQTILDSSFPGKYRSYLACISETQRDDKTTSVKQVCVPGTVKLYQKHLGKLSGLYYADIPQRYAKADLNEILPVRSIGWIFNDVREYLL